MLNLHVHWGTPEAGVNDLALSTTMRSATRIHGCMKSVRFSTNTESESSPVPVADGKVEYSIGRRSYGSFRVANCEFFLLDTRGARQMHDIRRPHQPDLTMLGHGPTPLAHGEHATK